MAFVNEMIGSEENSEEGKYLTFVLGRETYALEIACVREIIGIQEITPVPDMPEYVKGFFNLRGKVVPVMDARLRFHMAERPYDARTCIIVVHARDTLVGLVVDTVSEVLEISGAQVDEVGNMVGAGGHGRFVKGLAKVGEQVKIILDGGRLVFDVALENGGKFP